jgi:peptidoglycan biosynthesis protein MviN/MurJ (putative lipid II flippase)
MSKPAAPRVYQAFDDHLPDSDPSKLQTVWATLWYRRALIGAAIVSLVFTVISLAASIAYLDDVPHLPLALAIGAPFILHGLMWWAAIAAAHRYYDQRDTEGTFRLMWSLFSTAMSLDLLCVIADNFNWLAGAFVTITPLIALLSYTIYARITLPALASLRPAPRQ